MKPSTLLFVALICCMRAYGQQDPQTTMYMFTPLNFNPAATGAEGKFKVDVYGRNQWQGFEGSPKTYGINTAFRIDKINSGVGVQFYRDVLGFETNTKLDASYAYGINLGPGKLSFGLEFGWFHKALEATWITPDGTAWQNDPSIPDPNGKGDVFDIGAGIFYKTDQLQFGLSSTHVIESEFSSLNYQLARHYWIFGAYDYDINDDWTLSPSVLGKTDGAFTQIDVNARVTFKNMVWIGGGYRISDAFMPTIGYQTLLGKNQNSMLRVGYAYDVTVSQLNNYSQGSHELLLTFTILE